MKIWARRCLYRVEKLAHKFLHSKAEDEAHETELKNALADPAVDFVALEKEKIKGAIRTDFVLSAEIVTITLGTVATEAFWTRLVVLGGVSVLMTVGVYGLVAGIVKIDDLGLVLSRSESPASKSIGAALLKGAPYLMKALSVAGTVAMFLVGGGIITHGIPGAHDFIHHLVGELPLVGSLIDGLIGIVAGCFALVLVIVAKKLKPEKKLEPAK
jgi:predicted DNA repair protein MutK